MADDPKIADLRPAAGKGTTTRPRGVSGLPRDNEGGHVAPFSPLSSSEKVGMGHVNTYKLQDYIGGEHWEDYKKCTVLNDIFEPVLNDTPWLGMVNKGSSCGGGRKA